MAAQMGSDHADPCAESGGHLGVIDIGELAERSDPSGKLFRSEKYVPAFGLPQGCRVMMVLLIAMLSWLPVMLWQTIYNDNTLADAFKPDGDGSKASAIGFILTAPLMAVIAYWGLFHVMHKLTKKGPSCMTAAAVIMLPVLVQMTKAGQFALKAHIEGYVTFHLQLLTWILALYVWYSLLDVAYQTVCDFLETSDKVVEQNESFRKQLNIMTSFTVSGVSDHDAIHSFRRPQTANRVLGSILHMYVLLAKFLPWGLFLAWYLQAEVMELIGVAIFTVLPALTFLQIHQGLQNLLQIGLTNPCYLGDIISLDKPGGKPGGPDETLTGFVENFTWSHVVLRNFKNMQVWVHHRDFDTYVLRNWTRRFKKPVMLKFAICSSSEVQAVEELVATANKWVKSCTAIDQGGYKKICVTDVTLGYSFVCLFFIKMGESKKKIREAFVFEIMRAVQRLGISIVPSDFSGIFS